ncbi:MAG: hypothetical protein QW622_03550 [Candidatus Pacearchaeota archaeon]
MAVYVKLEVDEVFKIKDALENIRVKTINVENKGFEFEKIRNEKKRNSIGIISRIREIENEIRKIETMLPKESLEILKTIKPLKTIKQAPPTKKEKIKKTKKELREAELLKIKKQLEDLM